MATQEEIIKKQADQIDTLKKAISVLESRLRRLEQRERSSTAAINANARDIKNLAALIQRSQ